MEISFKDLINKLFNEPYKPPKSIQLSFVEQLEIKDIFEFLLEVFTFGGKKLFGNQEGKIDLDSCTDTEINMINNYCKSIGFTMYIDKYTGDDTRIVDFHSMSYQNININDNTQLKELKLPLNCKKNVYVIYFDYYVN